MFLNLLLRLSNANHSCFKASQEDDAHMCHTNCAVFLRYHDFIRLYQRLGKQSPSIALLCFSHVMCGFFFCSYIEFSLANDKSTAPTSVLDVNNLCLCRSTP